MTNNEGLTKHEVREQTSRVFRHLIILRCFDIRHSDFVISPPQSGRDHMCSITLSPNCEHLISVAPSINRAKSYVTRLLSIAPLKPLRIRSAASVQPMYRNIISPERITEPGFTLSRFAYVGAVPWVASKTAWPVI